MVGLHRHERSNLLLRSLGKNSIVPWASASQPAALASRVKVDIYWSMLSSVMAVLKFASNSSHSASSVSAIVFVNCSLFALSPANIVGVVPFRLPVSGVTAAIGGIVGGRVVWNVVVFLQTRKSGCVVRDVRSLKRTSYHSSSASKYSTSICVLFPVVRTYPRPFIQYAPESASREGEGGGFAGQRRGEQTGVFSRV